MKIPKHISIMIIAAMIFCFSNTFAQLIIAVPNALSTAFTTKYPMVVIEKWNGLNGNFIAEAKDGHRKLMVTFDQNGIWLTTTSRIRWSWNLPTEVRASIRSSKYTPWKIDGIKEVDSPSGNSYQLYFDDQFLHRDSAHALAFTHSKVLNFNADGTLASVQDIDTPLLF